MAAQLGEWTVFGTRHFEQALANGVKQGDKLKIEEVTYTPARKKRKVAIVEATLLNYNKEGVFVKLTKGGTRYFEWRGVMEFKLSAVEAEVV